jgi:hypothetical protein
VLPQVSREAAAFFSGLSGVRIPVRVRSYFHSCASFTNDPSDIAVVSFATQGYDCVRSRRSERSRYHFHGSPVTLRPATPCMRYPRDSKKTKSSGISRALWGKFFRSPALHRRGSCWRGLRGRHPEGRAGSRLIVRAPKKKMLVVDGKMTFRLKKSLPLTGTAACVARPLSHDRHGALKRHWVSGLRKPKKTGSGGRSEVCGVR